MVCGIRGRRGPKWFVYRDDLLEPVVSHVRDDHAIVIENSEDQEVKGVILDNNMLVIHNYMSSDGDRFICKKKGFSVKFLVILLVEPYECSWTHGMDVKDNNSSQTHICRCTSYGQISLQMKDGPDHDWVEVEDLPGMNITVDKSEYQVRIIVEDPTLILSRQIFRCSSLYEQDMYEDEGDHLHILGPVKVFSVISGSRQIGLKKETKKDLKRELHDMFIVLVLVFTLSLVFGFTIGFGLNVWRLKNMPPRIIRAKTSFYINENVDKSSTDIDV